MRRLLLLAVIAALIPFAAAQEQAQLDTGPGMITPNSPLYGLEVAMDNVALGLGLAKPGGIAQERAAEVRAMAERNNTKGMQKAAKQFNSVARKATADDTQGLEKAASVLQAVMDRAPEQAQQGLQTALNNVQQAGQRVGADIPAGPGGPGDAPAQGEVNATERMAEAREHREEGRQALQRGNDEMDDGNYTAAGDAFRTASDRFAQGLVELQGVNTPAAEELRTALRNAQSGANNLERSVEAYQNNDTQDAERYADRAAEDFNSTGGGQ